MLIVGVNCGDEAIDIIGHLLHDRLLLRVFHVFPPMAINRIFTIINYPLDLDHPRYPTRRIERTS